MPGNKISKNMWMPFFPHRCPFMSENKYVLTVSCVKVVKHRCRLKAKAKNAHFQMWRQQVMEDKSQWKNDDIKDLNYLTYKIENTSSKIHIYSLSISR